MKYTVGSINKYFDELISPRIPKIEKAVRKGQITKLENILEIFQELTKKRL